MKNTLNQYITPFLLLVVFGIIPVISILSPRAFGGIVPLASLLLLLVMTVQHRPRPTFYLPKLGLFLAVISGLCFASLGWGEYPAEILKYSLKIAYLFAGGYALLTFSHNADEKTSHLVTKTLGLVVIAGMAVTMLEFALDFPLNRLSGGFSFSDELPKSLANHAVVVFSMLLWPVLHGISSRRKLCLWSVWAMFVVLFSKSATATVALMAAALIYMLMSRFPKLTIRLLMIVTAGGIMAAPLMSHALFTLLAEPLSTWKGANAAQRLEIWSAVSDKIMQKPWLGWGLEACRHFKDLGMQHVYFHQKTILHPHSTPLQVWAEFGVVGAIMASALAVFVLSRITQLPTRSEQRLAACIFVVALIIMTVGYGAWQGWWIGLLFVTVAAFIMVSKENPPA